MPITSGSIEYERRLNLGEYNHKNVVAKVSWTTEPGEDDRVLADQAVVAAVARVATALNCAVNMDGKPIVNLVFLRPPNEAAEKVDKAGTVEPSPTATTGIPPEIKRHRRTKAEMEAARALEQIKSGMEGAARAAAANPTPELGTGTGASTTPTMSAGASEPHGSVMQTSEPGMPSFDPEPEPPAEVTDKDLETACQTRALGGLPSATIKELVRKFSPGALAQTPKEARAAFLKALIDL